jgi:4a-hydroxytetrahydrobiopterin dehydratase
MSDLTQKKCIPCEVGGSPLPQAEAESLIKEIDEGWKLVKNREISHEFQLADFAAALKFVNTVGAIAESEGHHPDILIYDWNHVRLTLSTHAIGGLSENDFILAAKIDKVSLK